LKELFSAVSQAVLVLGRQNFVSAPKTVPTSSSILSERTACAKPHSKDDYFLDSLTETEASSNGKQVFVEECRRLFVNKQSILRYSAGQKSGPTFLF